MGTARQRERYGVLQRASYAYGLHRAANVARYFGYSKVTVCEFGVADGNGLVNMIEVAESLSRETGIGYRIVGFDTGEGLPEVSGYKDHPEIWSPGDFAGPGREGLLKRVAGRAELIFGDINETIQGFTDSITPDAPLGFIAVDVDIYSATRAALRCLGGVPEKYCPAVGIYFDDVDFYFANRWCGELAALEEFNAGSEFRKIDRDRSLPGSRPVRDARWYRQMYVCHVLDHKARSNPRPRGALTIAEHHGFLKTFAVC
jgi:hypothetical protein